MPHQEQNKAPPPPPTTPMRCFCAMKRCQSTPRAHQRHGGLTPLHLHAHSPGHCTHPRHLSDPNLPMGRAKSPSRGSFEELPPIPTSLLHFSSDGLSAVTFPTAIDRKHFIAFPGGRILGVALISVSMVTSSGLRKDLAFLGCCWVVEMVWGGGVGAGAAFCVVVGFPFFFRFVFAMPFFFNIYTSFSA